MVFYRGDDVYDPITVGFVTQGEGAERVGFKYEARLKGNGNRGHLYGTNLSSEEKWALIEYVKTV